MLCVIFVLLMCHQVAPESYVSSQTSVSSSSSQTSVSSSRTRVSSSQTSVSSSQTSVSSSQNSSSSQTSVSSQSFVTLMSPPNSHLVSSRFERVFTANSGKHPRFTNLSLAYVNCSRACHTDVSCLRFTYSENSVECQLLKTLVVDQEAISLVDGDGMFQKIVDDGVCGVPTTVPNGTLLYIDGLASESKATFSCADHHLPTTAYGICSAEGVWTGLDNPCKYGMELPVELPVPAQIVPGTCVTIVWIFRDHTWVSAKLTNSDLNTPILSVYFDLETEPIEVSAYIYNVMLGTTESYVPLLLTLNQPCNMTLCTEGTFHKILVDGVEFITSDLLLPFTDVTTLEIDGDDVDLKSVQIVG